MAAHHEKELKRLGEVARNYRAHAGKLSKDRDKLKDKLERAEAKCAAIADQMAQARAELEAAEEEAAETYLDDNRVPDLRSYREEVAAKESELRIAGQARDKVAAQVDALDKDITGAEKVARQAEAEAAHRRAIAALVAARDACRDAEAAGCTIGFASPGAAVGKPLPEIAGKLGQVDQHLKPYPDLAGDA